MKQDFHETSLSPQLPYPNGFLHVTDFSFSLKFLLKDGHLILTPFQIDCAEMLKFQNTTQHLEAVYFNYMIQKRRNFCLIIPWTDSTDQRIFVTKRDWFASLVVS